jgi:hypothetical protein
MTAPIKKSRSFRAEREFGLIVGGVLLLLSSWWIYRGKFPHVAPVTMPLGALLALLGILWPRALVLPNKAWMAFAEALSFVMTRIILAVVFFGIVTPIGVIKRAFGWDPLNRRAVRGETFWQPYSERQKDPRHFEKMF